MTEPEVVERTNVELGQLLMLFYILCDVSGSMTPDIAALNKALERLLLAVRNEPVVDDVAQIGVASFSDTAKMVIPLDHPSRITMRNLQIEGGTNYGASFEFIAKQIENDIADLKRQGYKVYRPCVFFLTDGEPQDGDWHQTFTRALTYDKATGTGMKSHPIFVPFGFRDAREDVIRQLAYPPEKSKWFFARTHGIEEALDGILDVIMKTVMTGGLSAHLGVAPTPLVPVTSSAVVSGDSEYDPEYV
ncbi:MAG TPA: VWA domain-containing protein [Mycobacteriales bacterium]|nr:VWA domain-containing protein [Mycobacteriales bacterium]